jgi:hypothetical protein
VDRQDLENAYEKTVLTAIFIGIFMPLDLRLDQDEKTL